MKPINVVVAVITVIEALRAYDIIAALNEPRGTEVMGTLVTNSLVGEGGGRVGVGSAYGVVLFVLCLGVIIWYVSNNFREELTMTVSSPTPIRCTRRRRRRSSASRVSATRAMRVLL